MQTYLEVRGELYVTLESAAACYHVEARWIAEIGARGHLAPPERVGDALALPARELDRLAVLLRWHRHLGLELEAALALLDSAR
ncbi:MAG TPA: hypothetical protein VF530_05145 [Planctomycetota bacterium]